MVRTVNTIYPTPPAGRVRWVMCGLLFLATTINYIDRQVIALLKGPLTAEFNFSEIDYAAIVFSFQLAYAIGFPLAGRIMDTLGTRRGFALAVGVWSVAAMAHAAAHWFPGLQVPTPLLNPPSIVMLVGAREPRSVRVNPCCAISDLTCAITDVRSSRWMSMICCSSSAFWARSSVRRLAMG